MAMPACAALIVWGAVYQPQELIGHVVRRLLRAAFQPVEHHVVKRARVIVELIFCNGAARHISVGFDLAIRDEIEQGGRYLGAVERQNKRCVLRVKPEFIARQLSAVKILGQPRRALVVPQRHLLDSVGDDILHGMKVAVKRGPGHAGRIDQLGHRHLGPVLLSGKFNQRGK